MNITISVSTGRPERLKTPLGTYEFRHVKQELFFGYRMISLGEQSAFVATPEKALLDLIYLQSGGDKTAYLEELRLQNTGQLDKDLLMEQSEKFKSPKLRTACRNIIRLISENSSEYEDL